MKFYNLSFEISGIEDVYIGNTHYIRCVDKKQKFFKREKDNYLIPENVFMKKIQRLQDKTILILGKRIEYGTFGEKITRDDILEYPKWRFWFSGSTLNIKRNVIE